MIPYIILNKIYWYIWKLNQCDLSREYDQRVKVITYHQCYLEQCMCMQKDRFRSIKFDEGHYNYRRLDRNYNDTIYDKQGVEISFIPKNYK